MARELADRTAALRLVPVSRETEERFALFVHRLDKWRKVTNLISDASFQDIWTRHIADSAQLLALAPDARHWLDLGSGAGFPGIVLAIMLAEVPGAKVRLVESDARKCAFLRDAARETGAAAEIYNARVESLPPAALAPVDAVTARAFAPLPVLLDYAKLWLTQGATGVFPRGRTGDAQLRDVKDSAEFRFETVASRIDERAAIVIVRRRESAHESVPAL